MFNIGRTTMFNAVHHSTWARDLLYTLLVSDLPSNVSVTYIPCSGVEALVEQLKMLAWEVSAEADQKTIKMKVCETTPECQAGYSADSEAPEHPRRCPVSWWLLENCLQTVLPLKKRRRTMAPCIPPKFTTEGKVNLGGRNVGLYIGTLTALGMKDIAVILKYVEPDSDDGFSVDVPNANETDTPEYYRVDLYKHYRYIMQTCHKQRCRNIVRVYGVEFTGAVYKVYTHWYKIGDALGYMQSCDTTFSDACGMLLGAWNGLRELNTKLQLLHGDLSMSNVFVTDDGQGVIADLDHGVYVGEDAEKHGLFKYDRTKHTPWGTACMGSPFPHFDIRRDQVALLMNTLSITSYKKNTCMIDWVHLCQHHFGARVHEFSRTGYEANENGQIVVDIKMYTMYKAYLKRHKLHHNPVIQKLMVPLQMLIDGMKRGDLSEWVYENVHKQVIEALSSV